MEIVGRYKMNHPKSVIRPQNKKTELQFCLLLCLFPLGYPAFHAPPFGGGDGGGATTTYPLPPSYHQQRKRR